MWYFFCSFGVGIGFMHGLSRSLGSGDGDGSMWVVGCLFFIYFFGFAKAFCTSLALA